MSFETQLGLFAPDKDQGKCQKITVWEMAVTVACATKEDWGLFFQATTGLNLFLFSVLKVHVFQAESTSKEALM